MSRNTGSRELFELRAGLVLQWNQQLIALAEGGDSLNGTHLVGKGHHRAIAVDGVAGAGKIPLSAFVGRRFGLLGEVRRGLGVRRMKELNLGYGE
jgi:hypothetical protein